MAGTGHTYLVVPVESGDGLVCRIGTGREVTTNAASYAAMVTASKVGQVLALWKFQGQVSTSQAEEVAVKVAPTRMLICSSDEFGTLELSHDYVNEVEVVDIRPEGES